MRKMRKVSAIVIGVGIVAASIVVASKQSRWAVSRIARIAGDLHSLYRRVGVLEQDVDYLDSRTDSMEFDMKYNVKRMADFDIDIDDDFYDDDKY